MPRRLGIALHFIRASVSKFREFCLTWKERLLKWSLSSPFSRPRISWSCPNESSSEPISRRAQAWLINTFAQVSKGHRPIVVSLHSQTWEIWAILLQAIRQFHGSRFSIDEWEPFKTPLLVSGKMGMQLKGRLSDRERYPHQGPKSSLALNDPLPQWRGQGATLISSHPFLPLEQIWIVKFTCTLAYTF